MTPLTVDGWTVVGTRTYSATLIRYEISDGHGHRLGLLVPRNSTSEELAVLIRARAAAAAPLPPEGPSGPAA